jgi:hypothetical protein
MLVPRFGTLFFMALHGWSCESWLALHFTFTPKKEIYVALARGIEE